MSYSPLITVFIVSDTSLSRICFFGTIPALFSRSIIVLYAHISSGSFLLFNGSTKITLLSISTIMLPVWFKILSLWCRKVWCTRHWPFFPCNYPMFGSSKAECACPSAALGLVSALPNVRCPFFSAWLIWHFSWSDSSDAPLKFPRFPGGILIGTQQLNFLDNCQCRLIFLVMMLLGTYAHRSKIKGVQVLSIWSETITLVWVKEWGK